MVNAEDYLPLVRTMAYRMVRTLPRQVELDDLIQDGSVGLMKAVYSYDARIGDFQGFAWGRIKAAMVDGVRRQLFPRRWWKQRQSLYAALEVAESPEQVAAQLNLSPERLRQLFTRVNVIESLVGRADGDYAHLPAGFVPAVRPSPHDQAEQLQQVSEVQRCLSDLPPMEREVLHLFYAKEMLQSEVAAVLGVSPAFVSLAIKRALRQLRNDLQPMYEEAV